MSETKLRILKQARAIFNREGFASITLFELAQIMKMSRGNLAYHYKTKDDLLVAVADEMWGKFETERSKSRLFPSFENLQNEISLYHKIQKEYAFIFMDTHVLNHHSIKPQFRKITKMAIEDNKATIAFAIQIGNMKAETIDGLYNNLAVNTWMLMFFWLTQQIIRGEKSSADGEKMVWSLLLPHFTKKGLHSFEKFFGKEYLENLGEPFNTDIQTLVSF